MASVDTLRIMNDSFYFAFVTNSANPAEVRDCNWVSKPATYVGHRKITLFMKQYRAVLK